MSGQPGAQSAVLSHRRDHASDKEPLFTESISVVSRGRSSLGHTIPSEVRDILGLEKGDEVKIEIYADGYFVTVEDGDGDE
jgi:bifunctional DNA-binding transcriptional regulator/antitoxin component of YhaV-PrlF toxin-antitoxin module